MSQLEFSYMPIASEVKPKDQQDIMSFPCFSLSKKKRTQPIRFESKKGNYIEINPNSKFGMATIWDFDIMLYFVAYIRELQDRNKFDEIKQRVFKVSGYDILKFCGKGTGKSQYKQLRDGINRLRSTIVSTNIREETVKDEEIEVKNDFKGFAWIENFNESYTYRINPKTGKKKQISESMEIGLPKWFVDGVKDNDLVLAINPKYFQLTGGMERWLYRLARKHAGIQKNGFPFTLRHLHKRSGSTATYRKFKYNIKNIIENNNIPDYHFALYEVDGTDKLLMIRDKKSLIKRPEEFAERLESFKLIAESPDMERS